MERRLQAYVFPIFVLVSGIQVSAQAREGKVYDHFVRNDDLERAVREVRAILGLEEEGRS